MRLRARLQGLIRERGIKQTWLAAEAGIPAETLSRILTGATKEPGIDTTIKIADALGVSIDYLAGRDVPEPTPYDRIPGIREACDHLATVDPETQTAVLQAWEWLVLGATKKPTGDVSDETVTRIPKDRRRSDADRNKGEVGKDPRGATPTGEADEPPQGERPDHDRGKV